MRSIAFALALFTGSADPATWTFEKDTTGKPPEDFEFTTTAGGPAARWKVRKDGENQVVAQVDQTDERFACAIVKGSSYKDLKLSVRVKAISGYQRVGLAWRYQDADNYYGVGTNPRENNVTAYRMVNGKRSRVARRKIELQTGRWYLLSLIHRGPVLKVFLGEDELFEVEDKSFTGAGKIGLWIKDDSVAEFDDLTAEELE